MYIAINYKINFHFRKTISFLLLVRINFVVVVFHIIKKPNSIHDCLKFILDVSGMKAFQDLLCTFLL